MNINLTNTHGTAGYSMSSNEITVEELFKILADSCVGGQQIIEAITNEIEAGGKTILVTTNEDLDSSEYGLKMCVIGDGSGMSKETMEKLALWAESDKEKVDKGNNIGVGIKIASATRNPLGFIFESWQNGEGLMTIHKGVNGPLRRETESGTLETVFPTDSKMPELIAEKGHGTRVTFLGKYKKENTWNKQAHGEDVPIKAKVDWIPAWISRTFESLPDDVTIKVKETKKRENNQDVNRDFYRTVITQDKIRSRNAISQGLLRYPGGSKGITSGVFHWTITKKSEDKESFDRMFVSNHVAFLCRRQENPDIYELLDVADNSSSLYDRLRHFGIVTGNRQISITFQPDNPRYDVSRKDLKAKLGNDAETLDWKTLGDWFSRNMPQEILDFMEKIQPELDSEKLNLQDKEIMEYTKKGLFDVKKFVKNSKGEGKGDFTNPIDVIIDDVDDPEPNPIPDPHPYVPYPPNPVDEEDDPVIVPGTEIDDPKGEDAVIVNSPLPQIEWVRTENDFIAKDELINLPVCYDNTNNILYAHEVEDYLPHKSFCEQVKKEYELKTNSIINIDAVHDEFRLLYTHHYKVAIAKVKTQTKKMLWTTSQREFVLNPISFIHVGNHVEDLKTIIKRLKGKFGNSRGKKGDSIIPPTTGTNSGIVPEQTPLDV